MSVITTCVESELTGAVTDLSNLDRRWQEVKHRADELRSRVRDFGPCEIRFLEPKLVQLVSGLQGKHAVCVDSPEVRLSDAAKVFVLGDWATGLPQARNVAARFAEQPATRTTRGWRTSVPVGGSNRYVQRGLRRFADCRHFARGISVWSHSREGAGDRRDLTRSLDQGRSYFRGARFHPERRTNVEVSNGVTGGTSRQGLSGHGAPSVRSVTVVGG